MAMRLEYLTIVLKCHTNGVLMFHITNNLVRTYTLHMVRKRKLQNPITTASTNPSKNRTFEGFY